jgi:dienelactone hydrolase
MAPFLIQLASQGVIVLANGPPQSANISGTFESFGSVGRTSPGQLTEAIDWAVKNAGKGNWTHVDASRIAAAGQSCGGGDAYRVVNDRRVSVLGVFNSGTMGGSTSSFSKPVFYFLGGPSDMAYRNVCLNKFCSKFSIIC